MQSSEIRCEKLFKGLMSRTRIDLLWMAQGEEAALVGQSRDRVRKTSYRSNVFSKDRQTNRHTLLFLRE